MNDILKLLGNDGNAIKDIANPTFEMRLRGVSQKGSALRKARTSREGAYFFLTTY